MTTKISTQDIEESKPLGSQLKELREAKGLTLADMEKETRIRQSFLKALEEDRFEALPGETYIVGFLRNYAAALGLDKEEVLAAYQAKTQKIPSQAIVHGKESPVAGNRIARRWWLLLLVAVLLLVVLISLGRMSLKSFQSRTVAQESLSTSHETSEETTTPRQAEEPETPGGETTSSVQMDLPPDVDSSSEPRTTDDSKIAASPVFIPSKGALVSARALASGWLEVQVDDRPAQRYQLQPDTALDWRVGHSIRLEAGQPKLLALWLDEKPVDLGDETTFEAGPQP